MDTTWPLWKRALAIFAFTFIFVLFAISTYVAAEGIH